MTADEVTEMVKWLIAVVVAAAVVAMLVYFRQQRRRTQPQPEAAGDPFTIPKPQRIETAIATLEQILDETDDLVIREAVQNRLKQLRAEQQRSQQR